MFLFPMKNKLLSIGAGNFYDTVGHCIYFKAPLSAFRNTKVKLIADLAALVEHTDLKPRISNEPISTMKLVLHIRPQNILNLQ